MNIKYALVLCLTLSKINSFGHDQNVHQAITTRAAASAYGGSIGFGGFINVVSSDGRSLKSATNSMVDGSYEEDNADAYDNGNKDEGGKRSYNHFYDPMTGLGMSDFPPDLRVMMGTNSFTWASVSNCPGLNFNPKIVGISISKIENVNTTNIWSWQNARGYEWLGLTATDLLGRQTNLDNMFRAVGQVMHLLEDTSQPQHVRNEQHVDKLGKRFWESPIEDYGQDHWTNLNYGDGSMLNWRADGFTKLEDFWDRHLYNGSPAALNADTNGGTYTLGLAEWCNGNFIGDRHTYAESFYL